MEHPSNSKPTEVASSSIVAQSYWNTRWGEGLSYEPELITFKDLFNKYLPRGGTCFEVGCYPGRFLIYLGQTFGYTVNGVDAKPGTHDRLEDFVPSFNVKVGTFYEGDFFTLEVPSPFDVVCSFGFVEHFDDVDRVVEAHVRFVKPGGLLVISCPNFRRLQAFFRLWLHKRNLDRHVPHAMDADRWEVCLQKQGFQTVYKNYYQTCAFWVETPTRNPFKRVSILALKHLCRVVDGLVHWPNRWMSPYMILIMRRP